MRRIAVGVAVAAIAGVFSMAGLAFASGSLPATAVTAMAKHGISLPTQATANHPNAPDASQHGQDVKAVATDGTTGCQHGQEVAAVASSNRQDSHAAATRQDAANRPDPCSQAGSSSESSATGSSAAGQATNPTGYGKDNHPTGGGSGQANNPTGFGRGSHPGR